LILPIITGYIIGRLLDKRNQAFFVAIILGAAMGLLSTYSLIPLLYPLFTGEVGLVVIPEFDSLGIMFFLPDFVIYTETVYMLTRSYIIDLIFLMTGISFSVIGTWIGLHQHKKVVTDAFQEI